MKHPTGENYAVHLTRKSAQRLCGMYPLPQMGYEVVVALAKREIDSGFDRLFVQNVSGEFFAYCPTWSKDHWPDVFKVEIKS